ncbi:MAG: DUF488 domain-containing protein [Hyphomicrobiaceae bacterium]
MIKIKRIYSPAVATDGYRVLVDRLWPRGITRADANLDSWLKEVSPSNDLRKWFGHRPDRWDEFVVRYYAELQLPQQAQQLEQLREISPGRTLTLLYAARSHDQNNAIVIRDLLVNS